MNINGSLLQYFLVVNMFFFSRLIVSISLYTCIIILFHIVFIFDTGKELWVWIGRGSTRAESKNAMPRAHVRITTPPHIHAHTHTHISLVLRLSKMAETIDAGFCYHHLSDSVK